MSKYINIVVFEEDLEDMLPTNPNEFLTFWKEKIELIPEEFKGTARITIEASTNFEFSSCLDVKISYTRLETRKEELYRETNATVLYRLREEQEKHELKRLQAKYPDTDSIE